MKKCAITLAQYLNGEEQCRKCESLDICAAREKWLAGLWIRINN